MAVNLHVSFAQVRFLADLVNAKVVTSSSIMSLFDTFLTITYEPGIPQVCVCVCVCVCTILCIMYLWIICFGMLSFLYTNLHLWMCVLRCSVVNQPFLRPFFFFLRWQRRRVWGLISRFRVTRNVLMRQINNKLTIR